MFCCFALTLKAVKFHSPAKNDKSLVKVTTNTELFAKQSEISCSGAT
ncbi:hypothetical protein DOY81_004399 [Sarcophaga bullata]|nr:hypothetical protein DOY81_004399 [Sarcophaga bullata]